MASKYEPNMNKLPTPAGAPNPYPWVGARYMANGEKPGYIYDYVYDRYRLDPTVQKQVLQSQGVLPPDPVAPKTPGLIAQVAPMAGAALAVEGGKYLGSNVLPELGKSAWQGAKGLVGLGDAVATTTTNTLTPMTSTLQGISDAGGGFSALMSRPALGVAENAGSLVGSASGGGGAGLAGAEAVGVGEAAGSGLSGLLSPALSGLGILAGGYMMYDTLKDAGQYKASGSKKAMTAGKTAAAGASIGAGVGGPVGAAIGAGIGGLVGLGAEVFGSSKGENQGLRDKIRKGWRDLGILDENLSYRGFDMDQDGSKRLSDGRRIYEVGAGMEKGTGDPFAGTEGAIRGRVVGDLNPLNVVLSGGDAKATGYGTGMMFNMLYETGGQQIKKQDVHALYDKVFQNQNQAIASIDALVKDKKITSGEGDAYKNAVNAIYQEKASGKYQDYGMTPGAPLSTEIKKQDKENALATAVQTVAQRQVENGNVKQVQNPNTGQTVTIDDATMAKAIEEAKKKLRLGGSGYGY